MNNEIQIYQTQNGEIEFKGDLKNETIWGNINQIAELFGAQKPAISKHLKNIFESEELDVNSTVSKMETVQKEGERIVKRQVEYYNLDAIISVGYRVNSKQATEFRKWATSVLKKYLLNGYAINKKRLEEKGLLELEKTLQIFKKTLENQKLTSDEAFGLLDIITKYTNSWLLLQKYDENNLKK